MQDLIQKISEALNKELMSDEKAQIEIILLYNKDDHQEAAWTIIDYLMIPRRGNRSTVLKTIKEHYDELQS